MRLSRFLVAAVSCSLVLVASAARAQQFEFIDSFAGCAPQGCGTTADAAHPYARDSNYDVEGQPLIKGPDGRLYGRAPIDWRTGEALPRTWGTIFRIEPNGSRVLLHQFNGQDPGGCGSGGIGFGADGVLYSVGLSCAGTAAILKLTSSGAEVVQEFPNTGFLPRYLVASTTGVIFVSGTTSAPFSNYRTYRWDGTLTDTGGGYSYMVPASDGEVYAAVQIHIPIDFESGKIVRVRDGATVFTFEGGSTAPEIRTLIAGSDGRLYGVVSAFNCCGVFAHRTFRLTTTGALTYLTDNRLNAFVPLGATPDGVVFGSSFETAEHGTLMEWRAGTLSDVHTFDGTDGSEGFSPLTRGGDGHFYGVRTDGGAHDLGTLYRVRLPSVDIKANGVDGPVTVGAGNPLQISMAFDAASDVVSPSEVYFAVVTPTFQIIWVTPGGFSLSAAPLYSGPLPSFPSTSLINIPDAAVLPPGDYYWVAIVDADANGVPNGHYVDFVKTTKTATAATALKRQR